MLVAEEPAGFGGMGGGAVWRGAAVRFGPGFGLVVDEEVVLEGFGEFEEQSQDSFETGEFHFRRMEEGA